MITGRTACPSPIALAFLPFSVLVFVSMVSRMSLVRRFDHWRYERLARCALLLERSSDDIRSRGFFSQCGQDEYVAEQLFPGLRNGVFVDIGAHDGVSFSNTKYLEERLGWTGIAIEPLPAIFERLVRNRNCVCVNGCISSDSGVAKFRSIRGYSEMLSGLVARYDPKHLVRIESEVQSHGGQVEEIEVNCYRLNDLLVQNNVSRVHYLNIDVEGAEYDILQSIDFDASDILVCGVENNYRDYRIPALLKKRGYRMIALVGDEFYVKDDKRRKTHVG